MTFPHGFGVPLLDFAAFVAFAIWSAYAFRPATAYRWVFFVLCVIIALLFFVGWIIDLGAKL
jgi:hypothetical protein